MDGIESQFEYEDAESFHLGKRKDKESFRDIMLRHLRMIGKFASVEFRGGYWDVKSRGSHGHTVVYVQDSGEVYCNAVDYFADCLFPHFDNKMVTAWEDSEKKLKEAIGAHTDDKRLARYGTALLCFYREDQKPEDSPMSNKIFKNQELKLMFRSSKVGIKRKLFRDICCFLKRKGYFEVGSVED